MTTPNVKPTLYARLKAAGATMHGDEGDLVVLLNRRSIPVLKKGGHKIIGRVGGRLRIPLAYDPFWTDEK